MILNLKVEAYLSIEGGPYAENIRFAPHNAFCRTVYDRGPDMTSTM
jgi:hypothetical protein